MRVSLSEEEVREAVAEYVSRIFQLDIRKQQVFGCMSCDVETTRKAETDFSHQSDDACCSVGAIH